MHTFKKKTVKDTGQNDQNRILTEFICFPMFWILPKKASRLYLNVKKSVFFIHWDKEFLRDIVKSSSLVFKRHIGS